MGNRSMKSRSILLGQRKLLQHNLRKIAQRVVLLVVVAVFHCAPAPTLAEEDFEALSDTGNMSSKTADAPSQTLEGAVSRLVEQLVQQGNLRGRPVLISANDLYESQSRLSLPLAIQLRGKLITEMKQRGCRVLLPGADTENAMILQGAWQKQGDNLRIDLKVMKLGPSGPEAAASASESVPLKIIDKDSLTPDRESWARYLVRKTGNQCHEPRTPNHSHGRLQVKGKRCGDDLGPYLAGWIRPALAESRMFLPLDQQRASKDFPSPACEPGAPGLFDR